MWKIMKTVKLPNVLTNILSPTACYLTKMEMLLIFTLLVTSYYAIKMEMLLAETKQSSSSEMLIVQADIKGDSSNAEQSFSVTEKGALQAAVLVK